ncbi:Thyroid adenoma-associated protein-like protein [Camponotus floridanus]|uniref:Thyroid adenoma-associated protein-like protein n=1 Tax=Camponotus floridanus TaxID=104421 RepID=E2AII5_CAMFO|nr:Thyroid adenoma-associated protein-like protein [Camponotus floridanus]
MEMDTFYKLRNCQDSTIFRKLISTVSLRNSYERENVKECQMILTYIMEIISGNSELGNERVLLASHAFYALLPTLSYNSRYLENTVMRFQQLDSHDLYFFESRYTISDLELFKLLNAYGYLQANKKDTHIEYDILLLMFDIIYRNCMKYTRYSYFAYKVLYAWVKKLKQTSDTRFWCESNCTIERKLEAIIFSNWSNTLNDIRKQNAQIFNIYLRIMLQKYKDIHPIFTECISKISWQNEVKYIILTEICQVSDIEFNFIKNPQHLTELCISLTKNSLRCSSTKLYLTILRKLSEDQWKELFINQGVFKFIINLWESGKYEDHNALQSLFKYWFEPTIEMHCNVPFLWKLCDEGYFFRLHLQRMAAKLLYSSSFAEMGLAIDEKIKISEIETSNNYDELQLSPAHQVLISCIWMSLKVSCEIVSEIGMMMQSNAQVKYSMDIIVTVLLKCRHKGVVESAGVAIANLARRLYDQNEYSELPRAHLASLLEEDAGKSLHLTRRGAGLSIMFHRLVVSDNRRNRPTVHFAVRMLLRSLKDFSTVREVEPGQDSSWAKRLYFLRTLVADKEIHPQLVPYMEEICLTCFEYMRSDVWTVRNASLQLYGAVVPRLVGQCSGRSLDEELDFGYGYSVNHFVTHYPTLASHMYTQLRDVSKIRGTSNAALRSYSSVAHILVLLSKLSTSDCDLVDYPATIFITKVKRLLLISFLSNPMMYIRQLAAKVYTAFTSVTDSSIYSYLEAIAKVILSSHDINMSHGYLLIYGYLRKKINNNAENSLRCTGDLKLSWITSITQYVSWKDRYALISKIWNDMYNQEETAQPCYMLETLFLQELSFLDQSDCSIFAHYNFKNIEYIVPSQKIQPGFFQFIGHWARLHALHLRRNLKYLNDFDKEIIHDILNSNCTEQSIEFLNALSHCVPLLEFILKYLISMSSNRHQLLFDTIVTFTLNTIKHVSLENNELEFDKIIEEFNEMTDSSMIRVRNSLILAFSKNETLISQALSYVFDISMNEKQSVRLMAAEYIELALHRHAKFGNSNKLTIMRCCLILLKDEIIEIREIVSTALQRHVLHKHIFNLTLCRLQHEVVYQELLSDVIHLESIADDGMDFIQYFTRAVHRDVDFNATIENPFNHDDSTFYREESKFLNMCFFLYEASSDNHDDPLHITYAIQTGHFGKLREKAGFRYDNLQEVLHLKEMDYLARKKEIVIQQRKLFSTTHTSDFKS